MLVYEPVVHYTGVGGGGTESLDILDLRKHRKQHQLIAHFAVFTHNAEDYQSRRERFLSF